MGSPTGVPKDPNGTIELRFVNSNGETESLTLRPASVILTAAYSGEVSPVAHYVDSGLDIRIKTQAESITRLVTHVHHHHEELAVKHVGQCTFNAGEKPSQPEAEASTVFPKQRDAHPEVGAFHD